MEYFCQMEWTRQQIMVLIDLYKNKSVLWDHECNDRVKKNNAWDEIAQKFDTNRAEVQYKMRKLVGQFHREKRKMDRQGVNIRWFAFEPLRFLLDREHPRLERSASSSTAEDNFREDYQPQPEDEDLTDEMENDICSTTDSLPNVPHSIHRDSSSIRSPSIDRDSSPIRSPSPSIHRDSLPIRSPSPSIHRDSSPVRSPSLHRDSLPIGSHSIHRDSLPNVPHSIHRVDSSTIRSHSILPLRRKYIPPASEHIYQEPLAVKRFKADNRRKDEFDFFGEYIASQLRKLREPQDRALAKLRMSQVIFDLEMSEANRNNGKMPADTRASTTFSHKES